MSAVLEGLKSLGPARLGAMGLVALGMLGLLALLVLKGGTDRMALLYADLDIREAGQIAEQLERAHIPHQVGGSGSEILVPADQVSRARLLSAKDGLPSGGSIGYEIFDRGDSLTASQFQQTINQARALEGELARTIRTIKASVPRAFISCCPSASRLRATGRTRRPPSCYPSPDRADSIGKRHRRS